MVAAIKQCAVGNKRQPTDTFTLRQLLQPLFPVLLPVLLLLLLSTLQRPPQCPGPQIVAATPEICSCANSCPVPLRLSLFLSLLAFFSLSLFVHFDQVEFDKKTIHYCSLWDFFRVFRCCCYMQIVAEPTPQLRTLCVASSCLESFVFMQPNPVFACLHINHEAT